MPQDLAPAPPRPLLHIVLSPPSEPDRSETRRHRARISGSAARTLRISRGKGVIGSWLVPEVMARLAHGDLLQTDEYYDEEASDWLPLKGLTEEREVVPAPKCFRRLCYCG